MIAMMLKINLLVWMVAVEARGGGNSDDKDAGRFLSSKLYSLPTCPEHC